MEKEISRFAPTAVRGERVLGSGFRRKSGLKGYASGLFKVRALLFRVVHEAFNSCGQDDQTSLRFCCAEPAPSSIAEVWSDRV